MSQETSKVDHSDLSMALTDVRVGLRAVEYPSATLYLSPPSQAQLTRRGYTRRRPQDEIRYVETDDINFLVDPQILPQWHLTQTETLALIWGGLGKTIMEVAQEQGSGIGTCRRYRENLFTKLGVSTMTQAVATAFEQRVLGSVPGQTYPPLILTPRERTVLDTLSRSKTKEKAGEDLHVTLNTVRTHTYHLLKANKIANCSHATLRAYLAGQLPIAGSRNNPAN